MLSHNDIIFEDGFQLQKQSDNYCMEKNSILEMETAKFNVIHSSEISKVLRELTQCIANDQDLFLNSNKPSQKNENIKQEYLDNTEMIKPESLKSTSANTSSSSSTVPNGKSVEDKHICQQCGKQFSKRDFLQKHKIVHEIPRHKCVACDKSFVREDKLKRHFTSIHSKHRPHICEMCSKAFARKDKLKDHQKHHLTAGNSFQCTECNVPFVQKSDLNRHFRGIHKGEVGVGINIPSKRFVKSKVSEENSKDVHTSNGDQFNPLLIDSSQPNNPKTMIISSSFYPIQTSILPLNSNSSHLAQLNSISDLSNGLIKPKISFIPNLPLKVELNYTGSTTLPQLPPAQETKSSSSIEKENCQVKFKSKRNQNKSKLKSHNRQTKITDTGATNKLMNPSDMQMGKSCKNDSSSNSFNSLVSQSTLYSHIPIITPFQSPMISVFPTAPEFYSRALTTVSKPTIGNGSIINSPSAINAYNQSASINPNVSTTFSSSINSTNSVKPAYSLCSNNITFAHQNFYQFQQNQFRYYSYLQPGSHFFGQHSNRPLTSNIYPYMPFN